MKIPTHYRGFSAAGALLCGIAALIAFALVVRFSPFMDTHETQTSASVLAKAGPSPSKLFRGATAAMPETVSATNVPSIVGGDSRLDDYRLERESCCVGN
jgi:hypothetical protein